MPGFMLWLYSALLLLAFPVAMAMDLVPERVPTPLEIVTRHLHRDCSSLLDNAPKISKSLLERNPKTSEKIELAIEALSSADKGQIDEQAIARLSYDVDIYRRSVDDVASFQEHLLWILEKLVDHPKAPSLTLTTVNRLLAILESIVRVGCKLDPHTAGNRGYYQRVLRLLGLLLGHPHVPRGQEAPLQPDDTLWGAMYAWHKALHMISDLYEQSSTSSASDVGLRRSEWVWEIYPALKGFQAYLNDEVRSFIQQLRLKVGDGIIGKKLKDIMEPLTELVMVNTGSVMLSPDMRSLRPLESLVLRFDPGFVAHATFIIIEIIESALIVDPSRDDVDPILRRLQAVQERSIAWDLRTPDRVAARLRRLKRLR